MKPVTRFLNRFKPENLKNAVSILIVAVLLLAAAVLSGVESAQGGGIDLTDNGVYTLSDETCGMLDALDVNIDIYTLYSPGNENRIITALLKKFAANSTMLAVSNVDPSGSREEISFAENASGLAVGSIIVALEDGSRYTVLSSGSLYVTDGEGTALVTEACLLSAGRNPDLTKAEIERVLCDYLGVSKVIWLPRGIYNDETNEHVDNVCAFTAPGEVVLAWTDDEDDPQYALSAASLAVLETELDAKGRRIKVHRLPLPKPVTITAEECEGLDLCEGEPTRTPGERLAASYVNFYIANHAVVMPAFGDPADEQAQEILRKLFPTREIVAIPARDILIGGGNIHCITQQIPKK